MIRKDITNMKGGGCVAHFKNEVRVSSLEFFMSDDTQSVWCKIKAGNGENVLGVCCHNMSSTKEDERDLQKEIEERTL